MFFQKIKRDPSANRLSLDPERNTRPVAPNEAVGALFLRMQRAVLGTIPQSIDAGSLTRLS